MKYVSIRKKLLFTLLSISSLFSIALIVILSFAMNQASEIETLKNDVSKRATILKNVAIGSKHRLLVYKNICYHMIKKD
ncbi:hypothetical protein ACT7DF_26245 [Bacillus cereus]